MGEVLFHLSAPGTVYGSGHRGPTQLVTLLCSQEAGVDAGAHLILSCSLSPGPQAREWHRPQWTGLPSQ